MGGAGDGMVAAVTGSVLEASPPELLRGARALELAGIELDTWGGRIATSTVAGWGGLAALAQQARTQEVGRLVSQAARPATEAADAVRRCATVAEASATQVRRWQRTLEDLEAEGAVLRATATPTDPATTALCRARLEELEQQGVVARRRIAAAEEEFAAAQRRAAQVVAEAWSAVTDLQELGRVPHELSKAVRMTLGTGLRIVHTTDLVVGLARARWASGGAARARALARSQRALGRLGGLTRHQATGAKGLRGMKLVPGPAGMAMTWIGAWREVRDGGGYDGWRGDVTRVTAGAALVGGPLVVGGLLYPPLAVAGVGMVSAHQAWMAGNAVYDGVGTALRYARRLGPALGPVKDRAKIVVASAGARAALGLAELRDSATTTLASVGLRATERVAAVQEWAEPALRTLADPEHRVIGLPAGGPLHLPSRELVDQVVGRLPEAQDVRDWWRGMGEPIQLPDAPLGPVLRAPVELGRVWP